MLRKLLETGEITDSARAALVDAACARVEANLFGVDGERVLRALLERTDLSPEQSDKAFVLLLSCLRARRGTNDSKYLLREGLRPSRRRPEPELVELLDQAEAWLATYFEDDDADWLFNAVLAGRAVTDERWCRVACAASRWLLVRRPRGSLGYLLRSLTVRAKLLPWEEWTVVRILTLRWCRLHPEDPLTSGLLKAVGHRSRAETPATFAGVDAEVERQLDRLTFERWLFTSLPPHDADDDPLG